MYGTNECTTQRKSCTIQILCWLGPRICISVYVHIHEYTHFDCWLYWSQLSSSKVDICILAASLLTIIPTHTSWFTDDASKSASHRVHQFAPHLGMSNELFCHLLIVCGIGWGCYIRCNMYGTNECGTQKSPAPHAYPIAHNASGASQEKNT